MAQSGAGTGGGIGIAGPDGQEEKPAASLAVNNVKKVWGAAAPAEEKKPDPAPDNNVQKHVDSHYGGSGNLSLNKPAQPGSFG